MDCCTCARSWVRPKSSTHSYAAPMLDNHECRGLPCVQPRVRSCAFSSVRPLELRVSETTSLCYSCSTVQTSRFSNEAMFGQAGKPKQIRLQHLQPSFGSQHHPCTACSVQKTKTTYIQYLPVESSSTTVASCKQVAFGADSCPQLF